MHSSSASVVVLLCCFTSKRNISKEFCCCEGFRTSAALAILGSSFAFNGPPGLDSGGFACHCCLCLIKLRLLGAHLRGGTCSDPPGFSRNFESIICFPEELSVRGPTGNQQKYEKRSAFKSIQEFDFMSQDVTCLFCLRLYYLASTQQHLFFDSYYFSVRIPECERRGSSLSLAQCPECVCVCGGGGAASATTFLPCGLGWNCLKEHGAEGPQTQKECLLNSCLRMLNLLFVLFFSFIGHLTLILKYMWFLTLKKKII